MKRTFATKLEAVDAFGISNEVLRPRGFVLDKGTPARTQSWRRGAEPGQKARGILNASQTIEMEFNNGKVNITATAGITGRKSTQAQKMMTAYAEALEMLLAQGATPQAAGQKAKRAESAIKTAAFTRSLSICVILIAIIGGGAIAATKIPGVPNPLKWVSSSSSSAEPDAKGKKSPPIVRVRRAGAQTQTNAAKPGDNGE